MKNASGNSGTVYLIKEKRLDTGLRNLKVIYDRFDD